MMNFIRRMFALQQKLNDNTNGENWRGGFTREGRTISWYRCIYMEAAEAIDSFNWKHWKDIQTAPDWENLRIELVDIWHFVMSEAIRLDMKNYAEKYQNIEPEKKPDEDAILQTLEEILALAAVANLEQSKNSIKRIIDLFFTTLKFSGMDIKNLYAYYIVKNQLNIFRQKNGYKNGNYQKNWNGVEDNIAAFQIVRENPEITPEKLYLLLEKKYASVRKNA